MDLVFAGYDLESMTGALLATDDEGCAVLTAAWVPRANHLLVREIEIVPEAQYLKRTRTQAAIDPAFIVPIVSAARVHQNSLVFVHTHPASTNPPEFSPADDAGEAILGAFLQRRIPHVPHAALVLSPGGYRARKIGSNAPLNVRQVAPSVAIFSADNHDVQSASRFDRQIRAFGRDGQKRLSSLQVAVVGVGGTGSIICEQLAHLGVNRVTLIDPDFVDESNLNRLVGARPSDLNKPKVRVAARLVSEINPNAVVETHVADITDVAVAETILGVDAIFCCTDSHASRAILNQVAYQYYVPLFDMGVSIRVGGGRISSMMGRVQMAAPGLACLVCSEVIDAKAVRTELMSPAQRNADPYFIGHHEPQPAVISLNSTVASLAVTMFMSAFLHTPSAARLQYYNAIAGTLRAAEVRADPSCVVCSKAGALGAGHEWTLPGRTLHQ